MTLAACGLLLAAQLGANGQEPHTSATERGLYMLILGLGLGLGLGMAMPVLTLAVQNALPIKDIGTGTSSNLFFRNMGSSFGTAVFGAILSNRLAVYVAQDLGRSGSAIDSGGGTSLSRAQVDMYGPKIANTVMNDFARALSVVFETAAAIMVVAFVLSLFLKQVELRRMGGGAPGKDNPSETEDLAPAVH